MARERTNKRRKRNRSRASLLLKILCGAGVAAALTMGATVFFRVEQVEVTGNSRYTAEEIQTASGIKAGDNLFHMNKFQIEGEMRHGLPYLEEVSIRRQLPNGVVIAVKEWGAAAQVLPVPGAAPAAPAEDPDELIPPPDPAAPPDPAGEDASSSAKPSEDKKKPEKEEPEEELLAPAEEPWLISTGGKLLEPAPENCTAILVSGLTILAPEAGGMVQVPEEEAMQLSGLTGLLEEMDRMGLLADVSAVDVGETTLVFSYLGRFDVKIPLNADFTYKLNFLQEMLRRLDEKHGADCEGQIDLSREDVGGAYLPEL